MTSESSSSSSSPSPSSSASITIGSHAPDFTLVDQHGAERSLSEQLSQRPTMLVFYPFAFSRICGGELRELKSALPEFDQRETGLVAVSCDSKYSLRAYAEQEGFDFPLLADFWPHGAVARTYGVFDETRGYAHRASFLIDQEGTVRWSVIKPVNEARPLADYLSALTQATAH